MSWIRLPDDDAARTKEELYARNHREYRNDDDAERRIQKATKCAITRGTEEGAKGFPEDLDFSLVDRASDWSDRSGGFEAGLLGLKGEYRKSMEDAHLVSTVNVQVAGKSLTLPLFGVFDGHCGPLCSTYLSSNFPAALKRRLEQHCATELTSSGLLTAFKLTMVDLDDEYKNTDGSTATVATIFNDYLYVINTGDSRAILQNGDESLQLTEDAKPGEGRFWPSILKRGGMVMGSRASDYDSDSKRSLGVARTVGDKFYKCITARPKVTRYPMDKIQKGSATLVLACDGLFDVASTTEVCAAVRKAGKDRKSHEIAAGLVQTAFNCRSKDNVSVVVIKF